MKEIRLKIPISARSQLQGMSRKCKFLEKRKQTSPGVPGAGTNGQEEVDRQKHRTITYGHT